MTKTFFRALPLVGSALASKYNVNVVIGGDRAASNASTIFIPDIPSDSPQELMALARGYLDHEAAHIRETDFALAQSRNLKPLEKHVWNIIEDWRVERVMGEKYPGCKSNFQWLIRKFFDKDYPPDEPGNDLLNWILLTVRSWSVPELSPKVSELSDRLNDSLPGVIPEIEEVMEVLPNDCLDTHGSLRYAAKIVSILGNHQGGSQASNQERADDDSHRNMTNESSVDSDPEKNNDINPKIQQGRSPETAEILTSLLNRETDALPEALNSLMENDLNSACVGYTPENLSVARVGKFDFKELSQAEIVDIGNTTMALKRRLQSLLQSVSLGSQRHGYIGKLDTCSLHKAVFGQSNVFRRSSRTKGLNTAVHVLVDVSGSMNDKINLASQSTYSICEALSKVAGISVAATAFPGRPPNNDDPLCARDSTVAPILKQGEKIHNRFKLTVGGLTPLAEAICWTLREMSILKESRKIIVVITDGSPDSETNAIEAIKMARRAGFEIYGLGLGSDAITTILPGRSAVLYNMAELPMKLFRLLENAITINQ
jgi:cobalamin biosynthesis protein CobT